MRIRIRDPESYWPGIRNLIDPGSGLEKFGSGINIPDLQHWSLHATCLILQAGLSLRRIKHCNFSSKKFIWLYFFPYIFAIRNLYLRFFRSTVLKSLEFVLVESCCIDSRNRGVIRLFSLFLVPHIIIYHPPVSCHYATTLNPHLGAIIVGLSLTVLLRSAIENGHCYTADLPKFVIACYANTNFHSYVCWPFSHDIALYRYFFSEINYLCLCLCIWIHQKVRIK